MTSIKTSSIYAADQFLSAVPKEQSSLVVGEMSWPKWTLFVKVEIPTDLKFLLISRSFTIETLPAEESNFKSLDEVEIRLSSSFADPSDP